MNDNIHIDYTVNYNIYENGDIESLLTGKVLKHNKTRTGYHYVTLYAKNHRSRKFLVPRLVAQKFIPNPKNLPQVNHKDMDKDNNNASNLEWCSATTNIRHARKYGRNIYTKERNHKISVAKTGVPRTPETRKKLSEYMKGRYAGEKNPMYGKHLTKEQIQKRTHSRFHKNGLVDGCPFCYPNLLDSNNIANVN